ncbi:MAG: hypothetical protein JNL63_00535 [Bacteroidia bacterium]|nr:hypothetical protein [Bacteroidia bacterium]
MKKVVPILLVVIFLLNICGFYIVFSVMLYENRSEMGSIVRTKNVGSRKLFVLKIKGSDYRQNCLIEYIGENEIRHKGRLYDVVDKMESEGFTYFYCIHDSLDERIYEELESCIEVNTVDLGSKPGPNNDNHQLLKNIVKDYFFIQDINNRIFYKAFFFHGYRPHLYKSICGDTPYPPPRLS